MTELKVSLMMTYFKKKVPWERNESMRMATKNGRGAYVSFALESG